MDGVFREGRVRLRDGRVVTYAEIGDPDGLAVVNCHGAPSSRFERYSRDGEVYERAGVRLIGIDRPGFGGSDALPRRRVVDWPADAEAVLDALEVGEASVLSLSAGAPYALALARALPNRVRRVGLVGANPPPDVPWRWVGVPPAVREALLRPGPVSTGAWLPLLGAVAVRPAFLLDYLRVRLSAPDRAVMRRPEVAEVLHETFAEGVRQGWRPGAYDRALLLRPWGFPVAEVPRPVVLWHGTADWQAPLVGAQALAAAMPTAELRVVQGAGHFLGFDHAAEVLRDLRS
jgi:pimeloyl-ACP methyl ester carboxylesterase